MRSQLQKIPILDDSSVRVIHYTTDEFDGFWHYHPECELTYIVKSSGIRYVGNHLSNFHAGDMVLLGSNLPHCWKNGHSHSGLAEAIVIQWHPCLFSDLPEFFGFRELMLRAQVGLRIRGINQELIDSVVQLTTLMPIERYIMLMKILGQLADYNNPMNFLNHSSYRPSGSRKIELKLNKVQDFIDDNYMNGISLSDVSSFLRMSEQGFSRFFSKNMSRPFFVFLNEYRINVACQMLIDSDKSVSEIGYSCGFNTLSFFYQKFKEFKKVTPMEFRKIKS